MLCQLSTTPPRMSQLDMRGCQPHPLAKISHMKAAAEGRRNATHENHHHKHQNSAALQKGNDTAVGAATPSAVQQTQPASTGACMAFL